MIDKPWADGMLAAICRAGVYTSHTIGLNSAGGLPWTMRHHVREENRDEDVMSLPPAACKH